MRKKQTRKQTTWTKQGGRHYSEAEQYSNLLEFVRWLRKLPSCMLKRLADHERHLRPDPRSLPADVSRCVADWGWWKYDAGMRRAFGLSAGSIARIVEANDRGCRPRQLADLLLKERLKKV